MRHVLLIACLAAAVQSFSADKPAEKKAPWLVQATTNPVSYTDDHVLKIELKITNNTDAKQNLKVPRFWECHCDSDRLGFGGWVNGELSSYIPIPAGEQPADSKQRPAGAQPDAPPMPGVCPANTSTDVNLAPGESYTRSWNWRDGSKDDPPTDFTFRMGLVINGSIGDDRVWSSPITFKYTKPSDKTAGTK